jgi:hypothetical protein
VFIQDILKAIAALTPAQRLTLMRSYKRQWCVRCGRELQGKKPCQCGKPGET